MTLKHTSQSHATITCKSFAQSLTAYSIWTDNKFKMKFQTRSSESPVEQFLRPLPGRVCHVRGYISWSKLFSSLLQSHNLQQNSILLKGTVAREFRLSVFFHQSTPYMSLINRLKPFCIWHRIRRDNRFESRQNRFQQCH
jgi:hypothetical protein